MRAGEFLKEGWWESRHDVRKKGGYKGDPIGVVLTKIVYRWKIKNPIHHSVFVIL